MELWTMDLLAIGRLFYHFVLSTAKYCLYFYTKGARIGLGAADILKS